MIHSDKKKKNFFFLKYFFFKISKLSSHFPPLPRAPLFHGIITNMMFFFAMMFFFSENFFYREAFFGGEGC